MNLIQWLNANFDITQSSFRVENTQMLSFTSNSFMFYAYRYDGMCKVQRHFGTLPFAGTPDDVVHQIRIFFDDMFRTAPTDTYEHMFILNGTPYKIYPHDNGWSVTRVTTASELYQGVPIFTKDSKFESDEPIPVFSDDHWPLLDQIWAWGSNYNSRNIPVWQAFDVDTVDDEAFCVRAKRLGIGLSQDTHDCQMAEVNTVRRKSHLIKTLEEFFTQHGVYRQLVDQLKASSMDYTNHIVYADYDYHRHTWIKSDNGQVQYHIGKSHPSVPVDESGSTISVLIEDASPDRYVVYYDPAFTNVHLKTFNNASDAENLKSRISHAAWKDFTFRDINGLIGKEITYDGKIGIIARVTDMGPAGKQLNDIPQGIYFHVHVNGQIMMVSIDDPLLWPVLNKS